MSRLKDLQFTKVRRRSGFTLVEMLVTISIIGVLASLLMPAITKARQAARATQCSSNLKDFGISMMMRASRMPDKQLVTGNFDMLSDGLPTEIGWVADLVNDGVLAGEMMCPSSECQTSAAINQMATMNTSLFVKNNCVDRLGSAPYVSETGHSIRNIARTITNDNVPADSEARAALIDKMMLQNGFNTNYAATWFLVRSGLKLDRGGNPTGDPGCGNDPRGTNVTKGPLTTKALGTSKAPTSTIPLLCDAWASGMTSRNIGDIPGGSLYSRSIVGGPVGATRQIDTNSDGSVDAPSPYYLQTPAFPPKHPRTGSTGWLKVWNYDTRQDYRGIAALHSGIANVLMADGSVQRIADTNGDGFINNGFDPPPASDGSLYWTSGEVEADRLNLASFYSIYSKGEGG